MTSLFHANAKKASLEANAKKRLVILMNAEKYRHLGFVTFLIIIVKLLKYQKFLDFFIFFQLKLSFAFRIHRVPLPDHDIHAAVNALFGAIFVR